MFRAKAVISCLFITGLLSACASTAMYDSSVVAQESSVDTVVQTRSLIKSADISIEVENLSGAMSSVQQMINQNSGYTESIYDNDQKQVSIAAQVPAENLEQFVDSLALVGEVASKSYSVRDVTAELVDIDARLTNLRALRERYRDLLDKAYSVKDVVTVENELTRVQTKIDVIEARLKSLKSQVAMSRVSISLETKHIYGPLGYLSIGIYWVVEKLFVIK